MLKFAAAAGATSISGCFTPGTFTYQIQAAFQAPGLLVVTDSSADHQPLPEALVLTCLPLLCVADSPLRRPYNNKGASPVGLTRWMLAWDVLRVRGTISREHPGRSCLISASTGIQKSLKRKSRPVLKRL